MPRHFNPYQLGEITAALEAGESHRSIAGRFGCTHVAIGKIALKIAETGSAARRPGSGRPRKTSARTDTLILRTVGADLGTSCPDLQRKNALLTEVSVRTIERRVIETGVFKSGLLKQKPFISEINRERRLVWAHEHLNWTQEQWNTVIWSDESPYTVRFKRRTRCYRRVGAPPDPRTFTGTKKYDTKIMVWGCFAAHGVGRLCRIEGIMERRHYLNILATQLLPSAETLFPNGAAYIFQQDNDPKHTARINQTYIQLNEINAMPWPAQSPDLNPIENLWSILDQRVKGRTCKSAGELFEVLQAAWNGLPADTLSNLVGSMHARCQAVIDARGYPTKY